MEPLGGIPEKKQIILIMRLLLIRKGRELHSGLPNEKTN